MRPTLAFLLVLCAPVAAMVAPELPSAAPANASGETRRLASSADSTDPRLEALKAVVIRRPARVAPAEEVRQSRQAEAEVWLNQAGKLRAYRRGGAVTIGNAREARRLEYIALLNAERAGNEMQKGQRNALFQEIRADLSLPATQRCEVVARNKYFELRKRHLSEARGRAMRDRTAGDRAAGLAALDTSAPAGDAPHESSYESPSESQPQSLQTPSFDERLAGYADIERSLIQEFPEAANGYEGLLNIAHDSPQEQGMAIIRELLQMETLPPAIKIRAVILQSRYALPGRFVSELAPGLALTPGRETWLYTWSENNPGNLALAKMLAGDKPPDVELVGLCLGGETAAFIQINTGGERPPGRLVRDDGVMSAHLLMSGAGLAYRVDAEGVIRSVSLVRDMRNMQSQRANANAMRERSAP